MRICATQFHPVAGDIDANIDRHLRLIKLAVSHCADLTVFPELSLTGYEPRLAKRLAMDQNDARLDEFQSLSEDQQIAVGIGAPLRVAGGVRIGMIFFQAGQRRVSYSKQMLHADEMPFFVAGNRQNVLAMGGHKLAPAICYESLQSAHANNAAKDGADVYLASVAKPAHGIAKANEHYPAIAKQHGMTVLMANCLGPSDDFVSVGQSAIWNRHGEIVGQLNDEQEGLVMIDTDTDEVTVA